VGEEEGGKRKERSYNNDGFVGRVATRVGRPRKITGATTGVRQRLNGIRDRAVVNRKLLATSTEDDDGVPMTSAVEWHVIINSIISADCH
jgi:hypothetical protein